MAKHITGALIQVRVKGVPFRVVVSLRCVIQLGCSAGGWGCGSKSVVQRLRLTGREW